MDEISPPVAEGANVLCERFLPAARLFFVRHGLAAERHDLAHEALAVTLEALAAGRVRDPERAGGFLLGVCRNLARDHLRREARRTRASARALEIAASAREPTVPAFELWRCLNALPARMREVVIRSYVEEDDADGVAAAVGTTAGNVRVIRHRALAALLGCLEGSPRP